MDKTMNVDKIKPFHTQFCECKKSGFIKETIFESFEEHPEWLPALPCRPKLQKMVSMIKSGELKGMTFYLCGKFNNGKCNSGNTECKKDRGYE